MIEGATIPEVFFSVAKKFSEKVLFHYKDASWKSVTYGEFARSVDALSAYLKKTGINKGDRAAIVSENRTEWCMAYLAIVKAGAIAVPINVESAAGEVENLLGDSEAKAVFTGIKAQEFSNKGAAVIRFDSPDFLKALSFPPPSRVFGTFTSDINPDDTASLLYTSGTTGIPKGVLLSHKNFRSDALSLSKANVVTEKDNVLCVLPLHHTYPFMCNFLLPVFSGASITFSPSLKGPEMLEAIKEKAVTALVGVPQLLELMRDGIMRKLRGHPLSFLFLGLLKASALIRRKTDLNPGRAIFGAVHKALGEGFRFMTSGGAKLDPDVMKDLEALGFTVLEGYGLTETSPVVTFNPPSKRKPGSAGKPLDSVDIRILSEAGSKEGEIAIKGPMVMKGYYKNPEATASVMHGEFFLSGDLGYMDEEGYLFITGRAKEVIVLGSGKNVYPEEVEKEYMKIPLIKEICVMAAEGDDSLHAVIVPDTEYAKKNMIGNIYEAMRWELQKLPLPPHMRLKGFTLNTGPLPKTPLGKLRRFMIKGFIRAQERHIEVDKSLLEDEVGRVVAMCIQGIKKGGIAPSDNLELDIGLDSLKRIELIVAIESALSLKLPETFPSEVQTVGELIERIKNLRTVQRRQEMLITPPPYEPSKDIVSVLMTQPPKKDREKAGLEQGGFEQLIDSVLMGFLKLMLKVFFGVSASGLENIPSPPFIIAPNHTSNLDGFVVAGGVPLRIFRNLYFQGFQRYFTGTLSSLFGRLAHVIPIDPETYLEKALEMSGYVLKEKKALCTFPEGGRAFDGRLMEFKKGIGILAIELDVPVLPALIEGTFEALPRGKVWPKFKKLKLTFGRPLYPKDVDFSRKPEAVDKYQFFADEVRKRVLEMSKGH